MKSLMGCHSTSEFRNNYPDGSNPVSLCIAGDVTAETVKLFSLLLVLVGTRNGLNLYGRFDDAGFRQIVLLLLLASGISLIVPASIFH